MEKKTSKFKMLVVLASVCLISAAILGYVYMATFQKIEDNRKKRIENAVSEVLQGITDYEKVCTEPVVFKGYRDGRIAGYAVLSNGTGFQGGIVLMVGIDPELKKITGVVVLESVETPGLGDKIRSDDFLVQFKEMAVPVQVDAITGATISSIAVEKIVNRAIKNVKRIF